MLKKIGYITIAELITKAITYLLLPLYLLFMPKAEFGEFGFYFSTIPTISSFLSLSLFIPFVKSYCSKSEEATTNEIVSSIFISIFVVVVIFFVIVIPVGFISPESVISFFGSTNYINEKYWLFSTLIATGVFSLYLYCLLIARNKTHEVYIYILLKFFVVTFLSLAFLYYSLSEKDSIVDRLLAIVIAEMVLLIAYFFYTIKGYIRFKINWDYLIRQVKVALPLMPLGIIGILTVLVDRKFITQYHGLSELASYNLTLQLLLPIQMLMASVQTVWAPHLFSIEDRLNAFNKTLYTMKIALIVMIFGIILIWIVVKVALFYEFISPDYLNVLDIMIYASLGMIAMALSQLCNNMFVYLNKTSLQLYVGILVVAILFLMSYILIPSYSSVGAALSVSAANFIGLIVSIYILRRLCILNRGTIND